MQTGRYWFYSRALQKTVVGIHGLRGRNATHQPGADNITLPSLPPHPTLDSVSSFVNGIVSHGRCLPEGSARCSARLARVCRFHSRDRDGPSASSSWWQTSRGPLWRCHQLSQAQQTPVCPLGQLQAEGGGGNEDWLAARGAPCFTLTQPLLNM